MYNAIVKDDLAEFQSTIYSNENYLKYMLDSQFVLYGNESIVFLCSKFSAIKILSFIVQKSLSSHRNLLAQSLMTISDFYSNSILIECVLKAHVGENDLSCLNVLLSTMQSILNEKEFKYLLQHKNDQQMDLLTLLKKDKKNHDAIINKVELYMSGMVFVFDCLLCCFGFAI